MPIPAHMRYTGHKGSVYALSPALEALHFLSGSGDGSVVRWKLGVADGVTVAHIGRAVFSLYLDRKEQRLLIGDEDGGLHLVDLAEQRELQLERAHVKGIFAIIALPGDRLAVVGGDGALSIWKQDLVNGHRISLQRKIPLTVDKLRGLALNADGDLLAVACGDGTVRILETIDLNERFTLTGHEKGANCVAWHPTKPVLVSGGKDGHIRLWRADAGFKQLHALPAHKDTIYQLAFSPDGASCASVSRDKSAKVWDANTFDLLRKLARASGGHGYSVNALLWMEPQMLLTGSDDKAVVEWSAIEYAGPSLR